MKKTFIILGLLLVFVLAACTSQAEPTTEVQPTQAGSGQMDDGKLPDLGGREITVAVENAYLPFNYISLETGEAQGWDYDFLEEACKRLNCKPVYVEFAWDTMIAAVAQGQFDMAADGITITEERAQQVDFSDGYIATEQRMLVRIDETRFTGPDDFKADPNLLLAEQVGTSNYNTAIALVGEERVKAFDTFGLAVQALIAGDVDGVIIDETAGQGYRGENADKVKLLGPSIQSDQLGFIFPKGSDLVKPFNMVIAEMKADGTLATINAKWFGPDFNLTYDDIGAGAYGVDPNEIGGTNRPIKVLFVPSVEAQVIVTGGEVMAAALNEATGLNFVVSVPTSYAATIEEMCASPEDTMGFIPALGYTLANQLCGVDVSFKAIRNGLAYYYAQIVVARDSDIMTLADLAGKKWGYGDVGSTSGYMVPLVMLQEAGIAYGETVETGGHTQSVKAVYNGEVDFGTSYFSPPLLAGGGVWDESMPFDVTDEAAGECAVTEDGSNIVCGEWTILDARRNIRAEAPDVMEKVRVLAISPRIPNDTLSFGPDFPAELRAQIEEALAAFSQTEAWATSIGNRDFYGWSGMEPATDEEYDFVRKMVAAVGLTLEDLGR